MAWKIAERERFPALLIRGWRDLQPMLHSTFFSS
jgi:hypothetical protein